MSSIETNRRDFITAAGISSVSLSMNSRFLHKAAAGEASQAVEINKGKKTGAEKIILIMTDQQRRDMLNCYRETGLKTPNLDKIASEGMRFDTAYSCQPVCSPARSALFTGVFPHTTGVWSNCMPLGSNVRTVGRRLTDNGYHCGYIGKWHLDGTDYFGNGVCPQGWDENYWYDHRRYLDELSDKDRTRSRQFKTSGDPNFTGEMTYGWRCAEKAVDFMQKFKDEKYLLVVSFDEPHAPCICPEPYSSMYKDFEFPKNENIWDDLADKPSHQKLWAGDKLNGNKDNLRIRKKNFFGCNSFIDDRIGRVLGAVKAYADDALVFYTSDHGDMLYSHSLTGKGAAMYDEITRIPFLVRWKGKIAAGSVCKHPVSHIDLVPTMLDAAGLDIPPFLQGKSLLPALFEPEKRINDVVFMEWGRYQLGTDGRGAFIPIRSACDGKIKLVINLHDKDELYDLENDPAEMENLINSPEYGKIRDKLHDKILEWMQKTQDPFRGSCWATRRWRADKHPSWNNGGDSRKRPDDGYEPNPINYATGLKIT